MSRLGLVVRGRPSPLREVVGRPGAPDLVQLDGLVFRGDARLEFVPVDSVVAGAGHLMAWGSPLRPLRGAAALALRGATGRSDAALVAG